MLHLVHRKFRDKEELFVYIIVILAYLLSKLWEFNFLSPFEVTCVMELRIGLRLLKHSEKKGDYQDFCPFETAAPQISKI